MDIGLGNGFLKPLLSSLSVMFLHLWDAGFKASFFREVLGRGRFLGMAACVQGVYLLGKAAGGVVASMSTAGQ